MERMESLAVESSSRLLTPADFLEQMTDDLRVSLREALNSVVMSPIDFMTDVMCGVGGEVGEILPLRPLSLG